MKSTLGTLAALAAVALLGTACSTGTPDGAGGAAANAAAKTAGRQQAVDFADCMREHGVKAFPDPDASGELTADGVANNSSVDTTGPAWATAIAACKNLEPSGFTGTKRSAAEQATSLQFARCIRENGVEDFPDPDPNAPLINTNLIPSLSGDNADLTELNAAMKTCGKAYDGRLGIKK